ncbi:hypothetical protein H6P81_000333 [Aristolochia fimbriata]|uniref:Sulfotransferase n=1 Tax=Aristolochia fimbriata TaxID=158543 RepID=A0AAV7F3T3_ARIFI|nr:hypothetical protein H6P81_000333 [Aristolochia fimbriata]
MWKKMKEYREKKVRKAFLTDVPGAAKQSPFHHCDSITRAYFADQTYLSADSALCRIVLVRDPQVLLPAAVSVNKQGKGCNNSACLIRNGSQSLRVRPYSSREQGPLALSSRERRKLLVLQNFIATLKPENVLPCLQNAEMSEKRLINCCLSSFHSTLRAY